MNNLDRELTLMRLGGKGADYDVLKAIMRIRRLARAHRRLCEMDCNGEGFVKGVFYRTDSPKAFVEEKGGRTIFDVEVEKVEAKITPILVKNHILAEFQYDPRGATVKVSYKGLDITNLIY